MIELGRAMQDAADAALGGRPVVGAAGVVSRVRRRQAARSVGTGAVGMAAVGAVVVAGVQGGWWRDAGPVATPTTSAPEPSPRPTPPPGSWPAVQVAAGERFECGQPVPTILDPAGEADLHLEATIARELAFDTSDPNASWEPPAEAFAPLAGTELTQGDYWVLEVAMVNDAAATLVGGEYGGAEPTGVIVKDGVMVGQVTEEGEPAVAYGYGTLTLEPGAREARRTSVRWTACPAGSAVRALPGGEYDLYVLHSIGTEAPHKVPFEGDPGILVTSIDPIITLVGGPYPVTLQDGVVPSSIDQLNEYSCEHEPPGGAEDVQVSFEGLISFGCRAGTVLPIGWEIPEPVPSTSLLTWNPAYCAESPAPGRWVEVWTAGAGGRSPYFEVDVVDRRVVRIDAFMESTPEGIITRSSTLEQVQRAYPGLELLASAADTGHGVDAWAVTENDTTIVFEIGVDPAVSGQYGVGTVTAISLLAPGTTYDHPATGSAMCH